MTLNAKNTADVKVTWYFSVSTLYLRHTASHTIGGSDDCQREYVHFLLKCLFVDIWPLKSMFPGEKSLYSYCKRFVIFCYTDVQRYALSL